MCTKKTTLSSLVLSDERLPETNTFLAEEEEMPGELQIDAGDLFIVPFSYLCTVHSKFYNSSALSLLRTVFNI